ncbi:hypothetical protein [Salinarimonas ramus]|uniref:Uncharacterized protein n=1 Tax=Salinarimonas ramus TaxID=690164 RepID=A0A917Q813_9HYPH|nr:hypothetical protein [Salinarimonas ramus]GGK35124.1 hypothetical protein GCM10011322_22400 [Salinarimonas ramus]
MHFFRLPNRDLMPIVSLSFVFAAVGLGAVAALLAMPGPELSLAAFMP